MELASVLGSPPLAPGHGEATGQREATGGAVRGRASQPGAGNPLGAGSSKSAARRHTLARQRQVVSGLVGALAVCLAAALATGAAAAWWAVVALLPLASAYVAVVARSRRIAAEREIAYAFFGQHEAPVRALGGIEDLFPAERERAVAGR